MKAKLFNDNIMRGASISVDTFEGNVTLTGDKDMFQVLNMVGSLVQGLSVSTWRRQNRVRWRSLKTSPDSTRSYDDLSNREIFTTSRKEKGSRQKKLQNFLDESQHRKEVKNKQEADGTSYHSSLIVELRMIKWRVEVLYNEIQEKGENR